MNKEDIDNTEFFKTRLFRDPESGSNQYFRSTHNSNFRALPERRIFGKYGFDFIGEYPQYCLYGKRKEISKSSTGEWYTLTWINDNDSTFSTIDAYEYCLQFGEVSKCITSFEKWITVKFIGLTQDSQAILSSDDEIKRYGVTLLFHKGKYTMTKQINLNANVSDIKTRLIEEMNKAKKEENIGKVIKLKVVITSRWYTLFGVKEELLEETIQYFSRFGDLSRVVRTSGNWISIEYSSFIDHEKNNIMLDNHVFQIISGYSIFCQKGRNDLLIKNKSKVDENYIPVFHSQLINELNTEQKKEEFSFIEIIKKIDKSFSLFLHSIF